MQKPDTYTRRQIQVLVARGILTLKTFDAPPPTSKSEFKEYDLVALGPDNALKRLGPDDLSQQAIGMVVDPKKTSGGTMTVVVVTLKDNRGAPVQVAISGRYIDVEVSAAVMAGDQFWRSYLFKKQNGK